MVVCFSDVMATFIEFLHRNAKGPNISSCHVSRHVTRSTEMNHLLNFIHYQVSNRKCAEGVDIFCFLDISYPSHVVERIRQIYKTCEERVLPVPWCEDFSFHLSEIFTRLRIVNKDKTRGTLTEEITNMTAIFKTHEECQKPRTVLIEGEPGMGKTTYCQKLAYDWANRQEEWDESFPEIELLLLLRCHYIKSNIWEAIEEQILPDDLDEESKENFFKFIRENQSKVLLVLDGLDEADPSKLPMYIKLVEGRELPECRVILTSRHEVGMKLRRLCDTLWEIVGFTEEDAESFIFKFFKNMKHMIVKVCILFQSSYIREMTSNPLNTALLCVLCEDFEGDLPTSRTQLYIEIVLCVLKRYEKKKGLSSTNEDLIKVYKEELIHLGLMALTSLRKGELYIEENECGSNSTALTKFGFLSVQAAGSRRKPCLRYGFLHKSFQEFFSGFYLASKILSGDIDLETVVTDERYFIELKQVFLFMSGIIVSKCEETAVCLVKSISAHINCNDRSTLDSGYGVVSHNVKFAFDCIKECITYKETLQSRLVSTFGSHLNSVTLKLKISETDVGTFSDALTVNTTLTHLDFGCTGIGVSGAASLSKALTVNSTLTDLNLSWNGIGDSGAGPLSDALVVNTSLTALDLSANSIGDSAAISGFSSLCKALSVNTTLTNLRLGLNQIGDSGVGFLSEAFKVNTALTDLDLSLNEIGDSGASSLSKALTVNTTLTHLNLSENKIGDSGTSSLSDALTVNTTLTKLDLSKNGIGDSGAGSLSKALTVNSTLTQLDLSENKIAASFSNALAVNSTLTYLSLSTNRIGDSDAGFLFDALTVNTSLTHLDLSCNGIGDSAAGSLCDALSVNTTLTRLDFSLNVFGDCGTGSLSKGLSVNTTLTHLSLRRNEIGDSGAGSLSDALTVNTSLTDLDLAENRIGDSGAGFLSKALIVNTALTHLDLCGNGIGDSGAGFLFDALTVSTKLTYLNLCLNRIDDSAAGSLCDALSVNTTLTRLDLSLNVFGDCGTGSLSKALSVNTTLTHLSLRRNEIGDSGAGSLSKALTVNNTLTYLDLSWNWIGDSGAAFLSDALSVNTSLTHLDLRENKIAASGAGYFSKALTVNTALTELDLSMNRIGDHGAGSLSKALTVNTTLTDLDLRSNLIGDSGRASLSDAQTVNNTCSVALELQIV